MDTLTRDPFSTQQKKTLERVFTNNLFSAICQLPNPGRYINDPTLNSVLLSLRTDFTRLDATIKAFPVIAGLCAELLAAQSPTNNLPFRSAEKNNNPPLPIRSPPLPIGRPMVTATVLHNAARDGNIKVIQDAANVDSIIMYEGDDVGYNVLHIAAQHGRMAIVKYLVEDVKMDCNCVSLPGYTPLILASMEGQAQIVTYLLKQGANLYQADSENKTAIDYALIFNHEGVIKALFPDERDRLKLSSSGEIPVIQEWVETKVVLPKTDWWEDKESDSNKTIDNTVKNDPMTPVKENWEDSPTCSVKVEHPSTPAVNTNSTTNVTAQPNSDTTISFSSEEQTRLDQLVDSVFGTDSASTPLQASELDVMLLIRRIVQLEHDVKVKHEKTVKLEEQSLCCICLDNRANVVLLECNHLIVCQECTTTKQLKHCPICNNQITRVLKIYHAS